MTMRWLRYGAVAAAGIVAGAASCVLLALAGALVLQLIAAFSSDPSVGDSFGWLLVFGWPVLLALLLGAGGFVGVVTAALVHKKLPGGDTAPGEG
jgi:hypothetical protein